MTKAGAYAEEIYDREESYWDGMSYDEALDSLLRDRKGNLVREATPMIVEIAENIAQPTILSNEIDKAETVARIEEIEKDVVAVEISKARKKLSTSLSSKKAELRATEEAARKEIEAREKAEVIEIAKQKKEIAERTAREAEEVERVERTLIEEASTMAFNDGKISKIVKTEEERRDLSLREKQIIGRYMTQLR